MKFIAIVAVALMGLAGCTTDESPTTTTTEAGSAKLSCESLVPEDAGMGAACNYSCNNEPYNCPDELCACEEVEEPSDDEGEDEGDDEGEGEEEAPADDSSRKTIICHLPPGHPENAHTIKVGNAAVEAHLAHGDTLGACAGDDADDSADEGEDGDDEGDHDAADADDSADDAAADDDSDTDDDADADDADAESSDEAPSSSETDPV